MLADELAAYLDSLGLVNYDPAGYGGDTFLDRMPAAGDSVIVITETAGAPPDGRLGYDTPHAQVRARAGRDPRTARARLRAIYEALHNLQHVTLPGGTYLVVCRALQSAPAPLGPDANGRFEYTQNYELHVRNVTAHRV